MAGAGCVLQLGMSVGPGVQTAALVRTEGGVPLTHAGWVGVPKLQFLSLSQLPYFSHPASIYGSPSLSSLLFFW